MAMFRRLALIPARLLLGLPALYGMSIKNRCQQIGRRLGLYRGPIHYVIKARCIHVGAKVNPLARKA